MNRKHYGIPATIELKTPEFKSAFGALLRVRSETSRRYFPVPKDVRKKIYAVSPAFRELHPFLEGSIGKSWQNLAGSDDIPVVFLIWVLRDAVAHAGYAENGPDALHFYTRMGEEINQACEAGKLDCHPRRATLIPHWHKEYNTLLLPTFFSILKRVVTFSDFSASTDGMMSFGSRNIMVIYETVTRENLLTSRRDRLKADPDYHHRLNNRKRKILNIIGTCYQRAIPVLFLLALVIFPFIVGRRVIKRQNLLLTAVSGAALIGLLSISFILTLFSITVYSHIERPLHTAYPMVLLFIATVVVELTDGVNRGHL